MYKTNTNESKEPNDKESEANENKTNETEHTEEESSGKEEESITAAMKLKAIVDASISKKSKSFEKDDLNDDQILTDDSETKVTQVTITIEEETITFVRDVPGVDYTSSSSMDEREETTTKKKSTATAKQVINKDDSVIISIDEELASGDITEDRNGDIVNKEKNFRTNKKIMQKLIHLDDENPNRLRYKIRPQKTIWAYVSIYSMNQVEPDDTFDYDDSRNDFLILVFSLLLIMLSATALIAGGIYSSPELSQKFSFGSPMAMMLFIIALVVLFMVHYAIMCSECTRRLPCNIICLIITTLAMSIIVAIVIVRYRLQIVLLAVIITAGTVLFCLVLACTSFDFTRYYLYLMVFAVAFFLLAIVLIIASKLFNVYYKPVHIAMLCGAILISVFSLIMELQMVLGGRTIEIGEDDYALAAYMLYLSIINMFLNIIRLLGLVLNLEDLEW